jgi:D-alanyl-D-alanine carboxypeptidase
MTPEQNIKERILAILTVIILFSVVGTLFGYISYNNKKKTDALKKIVLENQIRKEKTERFNKIQFDDLPLLDITSKSFLTMITNDLGTNKILAQKNPDLILPIASITKLMVAIITLENINPETEITATLDYIGKEESAYILEVDKTYKVKELLANALISSDNDSARLLAGTLGESNFIDKMNIKALELGLTKTNFVNVTGLDPVKPDLPINNSSATDLAKLLIYIKDNHPEIFTLTTKVQYNFCDTNNNCKPVTSTNKLLEDKTLRFKILGGKTGSTDIALKNLALISEISDNIYLINIVLGSKNNFMDSVSLINHVKI